MTEEKVLPRLFDREVSEESLQEGAAQVAARKKVVETGTTSIVIFRLQGEWLALPTEVFQEVIDRGVVRTVPHHRGGILRGLVNIRGELLLCVSLERLLGLEQAASAKEGGKGPSTGRLLICSHKGDRLAFRADEVFGLYRYHPGHLRNIPATLAEATAGNFILGLLPWNDKTVGCLDAELLFYGLNRSLE